MASVLNNHVSLFNVQYLLYSFQTLGEIVKYFQLLSSVIGNGCWPNFVTHKINQSDCSIEYFQCGIYTEYG